MVAYDSRKFREKNHTRGTNSLVRGSQPVCPKCEGRSKVIETGWSKRFNSWARQRVCEDCDTRFFTVETVVPGSAYRRQT